MQKPQAAARQWGEALNAINGLLARRREASGDGFADRFPAATLARLLAAKLATAFLSKADWIAIGSIKGL